MLQINFIRENAEAVKAGLAKKHFKNIVAVDELLQLDEEKRKAQVATESNAAEANQLAKKIGELMKAGNKEEAEVIKARTSEIKENSKQLEERLKQLEDEIFNILVTFPNLPISTVPAGRTPEENVTVYTHGSIPILHEGAMPHWELAAKYDIIDFELGNKITGAGFPVYKGKGARLQRALINFFLDEATKAGYHEIMPPLMINADSGFGTGQLPDKEGQMYHVTVDDLYLIPTAEVPITNLYRDVILKEEDLRMRTPR